MAASTAVSIEDTPRSDPPATRAHQVAALTGLRGFAALMVVLVHVSGRTEYSWLGLQGYGPVSLFVLSGYLLFRPWSRWGARTGKRPSVRVFARRRLLRIFPAYLVVLGVVLVIYPPSRPVGVDGWVRAVTLTGIYASDGLRPGLEQTWSLGTELSWYVVLPVFGVLTALLARRWHGRRGFWASTALILLALPLSAAWRSWIERDGLGIEFTYSFWFPGYAFCFAAGALVAHVVQWRSAGVIVARRLVRVAQDPWILVVLAVAFALVGTSSLGGPDGYVPGTFVERQVRTVCATLVALVLLVAVVLGGPTSPVNRLLSTRLCTAIGRWSYGIYLWHLPLVVVLEDEMSFPAGTAGLLWTLGVVLGLSVPLGAATYHWVERPMIALSHRDRRTTAVAGDGVRPQPRWRARLHRTARPTPTSASVPSHASTATPATSDNRSPGE